MKALRVDFDQPGAAVHQAISPSRAPNQCSACRSLAGQVALRVDDAARLAGRARGEDDRRRVGRGRGRPSRPGSPGRGPRRRPGPGRPCPCRGCRRAARPGSAASPTQSFGPAAARPQLEVLAAQLRVAGQGDGAHPPAGEHRQHPLGAAADQRHDDVAAARPRGRRRRPRGRPSGRRARRSGGPAASRRRRPRSAPGAPPGSVRRTSSMKFTGGSLPHVDAGSSVRWRAVRPRRSRSAAGGGAAAAAPTSSSRRAGASARGRAGRGRSSRRAGRRPRRRPRSAS